MSIICSKYQSTRDFSFSKGCFVSEASGLGRSNHDGRVYDDACDVGFIMVSHLTGKEILFVQDGTDQDPEGDVAGWRYCANSIKEEGRWKPITDPLLKKLSALVIND